MSRPSASLQLEVADLREEIGDLRAELAQLRREVRELRREYRADSRASADRDLSRTLVAARATDLLLPLPQLVVGSSLLTLEGTTPWWIRHLRLQAQLLPRHSPGLSGRISMTGLASSFPIRFRVFIEGPAIEIRSLFPVVFG